MIEVKSINIFIEQHNYINNHNWGSSPLIDEDQKWSLGQKMIYYTQTNTYTYLLIEILCAIPNC